MDKEKLEKINKLIVKRNELYNKEEKMSNKIEHMINKIDYVGKYYRWKYEDNVCKVICEKKNKSLVEALFIHGNNEGYDIYVQTIGKRDIFDCYNEITKEEYEQAIIKAKKYIDDLLQKECGNEYISS